ncbi:MAG: polysaccharide deacetylase family protein [Acidimicrobiales bacterium]
MGPARRRWRRLLGAVAALFLAGLGAYVWLGALPMAKPSLSWSFSPSTNRLQLSVVRGRGPLATWVASRTLIQAPGRRSGHHLVLSLRPGARLSWLLRLDGPVPSSSRLSLVVPSAPALLSTGVLPTRLVLRFDTRISAVAGYAGAHACRQRSACLPRGVYPTEAHLAVVAPTGEASSLSLRVPALPAAPLVWFGNRGGNRVYITIDDGWFPSGRVLGLVRSTHLPVTTFLIAKAAAEHLAFYKALAKAGVHIEDHTVTHPRMTRLPFDAQFGQWAENRSEEASWFGHAPGLGRPPYGAVSRSVMVAAHEAGLRALVMWSAEVRPGKGLTTWDKAPLAPGEIILLHWVPGLYGELVALVHAIQAAHLHPAYLTARSLGA